MRPIVPDALSVSPDLQPALRHGERFRLTDFNGRSEELTVASEPAPFRDQGWVTFRTEPPPTLWGGWVERLP